MLDNSISTEAGCKHAAFVPGPRNAAYYFKTNVDAQEMPPPRRIPIKHKTITSTPVKRTNSEANQTQSYVGKGKISAKKKRKTSIAFKQSSRSDISSIVSEIDVEQNDEANTAKHRQASSDRGTEQSCNLVYIKSAEKGSIVNYVTKNINSFGSAFQTQFRAPLSVKYITRHHVLLVECINEQQENALLQATNIGDLKVIVSRPRFELKNNPLLFNGRNKFTHKCVIKGVPLAWSDQEVKICSINENNVIHETNEEKANLFANKFSNISSRKNHSSDFQNHSKFLESTWVSQSEKASRQIPELDIPFEWHELMTAIKQSERGSAPRADNITYEMIQHLQKICLEKVLWLYNKLWSEGKLMPE